MLLSPPLHCKEKGKNIDEAETPRSVRKKGAEAEAARGRPRTRGTELTVMPPRNPHLWMWAEACEMLERADRLHRQFFQVSECQQKGPSWEPPVDLYETAEEIGILVALPGVEPAHVQVVIEEGVLIVTGVRTMPAADRASVIRRLEIPHGRFERRVELPAGQYELRRRELVNGCLVVTLRKL